MNDRSFELNIYYEALIVRKVARVIVVVNCLYNTSCRMLRERAFIKELYYLNIALRAI